MDIKIIQKSDTKVSGWSGGITREWLIWPPTAEYIQRNFQCRISTAQVDLPESVFTPLPDVHRFIAPLNGELTLIHNGHIHLHLQPLQVHEFPGDWQTLSRGQAEDLNLMLKGIQGAMTYMTSPEGISLDLGQSFQLEAWYFLKEATLTIGDHVVHVNEGEMVLIHSMQDKEFAMAKVVCDRWFRMQANIF